MSFTIPMCQYCGEHEVGTWASGSVHFCSEVCEEKAWDSGDRETLDEMLDEDEAAEWEDYLGSRE